MPPPPPTPPPPTPAAPANRPPTVKARVQPVHGGSRPDLDGDGRRRSDPDGDTLTYRWSGADGHVGQSDATADALDRAGAAGRGARHGDGRRRQGRHGVRHGHDSGGAAGGEGVRVRGRALRLRPLHAAAGRDAGARRSHQGDAGEPGRCGSRSKATPATSARPNTTWRSASAARTAVRDYLHEPRHRRPTGCGR